MQESNDNYIAERSQIDVYRDGKIQFQHRCPTAFLHSTFMQQRRGMMKNWNVWLIFSTFMLRILGTLLTRSGIVSSVHAFGESSIGNWFWIFLVLVLLICTLAFARRRDHLKSEHEIDSLVSRDASVLFGVLVLLAACATVFLGTLFPVFTALVDGNKVTVGPPFYDFYFGIIYQAVGFKPELFTVLFAIPRTVGWLAQWQEMLMDPEQKIARPRQIYTGQRSRHFLPIK